MKAWTPALVVLESLKVSLGQRVAWCSVMVTKDGAKLGGAISDGARLDDVGCSLFAQSSVCESDG